MQTWKKALIVGSLGAGAVLIFGGRRGAGSAVAAFGLTVLASEYPEKFEAVWENAPDYLQKGMQLFGTLRKIGDDLLHESERRSTNAWQDMRAQFGD